MGKGQSNSAFLGVKAKVHVSLGIAESIAADYDAIPRLMLTSSPTAALLVLGTFIFLEFNELWSEGGVGACMWC